MQTVATPSISEAEWVGVEEVLSRVLGSSTRRGAVAETPIGSWPERKAARIFATVLFTDIVGSTARVAELGDGRWRALLERFHALVQQEVRRAGGRVVNAAGDEVFATFDGPTPGIQCARAINAAVRKLGLQVKTGLHAGECAVAADDVVGIAVHIGARVSVMARPGEVLVSSTVKDLVAGSGMRFTDRGAHVLKGVPGQWRLFATD